MLGAAELADCDCCNELPANPDPGPSVDQVDRAGYSNSVATQCFKCAAGLQRGPRSPGVAPLQDSATPARFHGSMFNLRAPGPPGSWTVGPNLGSCWVLQSSFEFACIGVMEPCEGDVLVSPLRNPGSASHARPSRR